MGDDRIVWRCPNGDGDSQWRICWLCKAECELVIVKEPGL